MDTVLETSSTVDTSVVGQRAVQWLIDIVATNIGFFGPFVLVVALLPDSGDPNRAGDPSDLLAYTSWALGWLFAAWYWVLRPYGHDGQTFGMQLLGVRVVDMSGGRARRMQLAGRALLLPVDGFFLGLVGLAAMTLSRRNQRLGDMAAGTLVVRA